MKAIKKLLDTTPKIIGAVVVLLLLIFWGVLFVVATPFAIALVKPVGISVVVLVLAWVGIHFGVKAWRKRKRKDLDEAIAAKEGIADRKREWNDWVEELEKRDIDRYELPFYLLVGEPQSGKSVLLHNSDLHFPFGQNRLSGVGGTRGCDWWFTEEAVILDLAGRLFTHEGGASDRLEFEAFLDLLHEFRPLCPANGVILVVPCDSLLKDSAEVAQAKAVKIQNALASLSAKLQAQLPVYLVLTKGDQIFGFAESVHRLDVEHRHQMFGWSRPATKIDAPFDSKEALQGFDALVARSRLLRGHMLAGARLPEALPEVDRMFAFPHELAGLRANLETYLTRVFTESSATERVFFRGLYLTSGLQSGVPIAKVCSELYGQTGEADKRDLEALFSKPKAYFIKDLVRTRIFGERGLVRPTQGRVKNTKRTSAIAYGIAGLLVLLSLVFATAYLAGESGDAALATRTTAIELARKSAQASTPDAQQILGALGAVNAAIELPEASTETAFGGAKEEFQRLFRTLFDERLAPELQRLAAAETQRRMVANEFADHEDLLRGVRAVAALVSGVDLVKESDTERLIGGLPPALRVDAPARGSDRAISVAEAIRVRRGLGEEGRLKFPSTLDGGEAVVLADRALAALQSCSEPGSKVQPGGALGFMLAWLGAADVLTEFDDQAPNAEDARVLVRRLGRARAAMDAIHTASLAGQSDIALRTLISESTALIDLRGELATAIERTSGSPTTQPGWAQLVRVVEFAKALSEQAELSTLEAYGVTSPSSEDVAMTAFSEVSALITDVAAKVPIKQPRFLFDSFLDNAAQFEMGTRPVPLLDEPGALVGLAQCLRDIEAILMRLAPVSAAKVRPLYVEQCTAAATEFTKEFASTTALLRGLGLPDTLPAGALSDVLVSELAELHVVLGGIVSRDDTPDNVVTILQNWREELERHMFEHLNAVKSLTPLVRPVTSAGTFDDETWKVLRALATVARLDVVRGDRYPVERTGATLLGDLYFREAEELERLWASRGADRIANTIQIVTELSAFCTRTKAELGGFDTLKQSGSYEAFSLRLDGLVADRLRAAVAEVHLEWSAELGDTSVSLAASNALEILGSVPQRVRNSEAKELHRLREITAEFGDASSIREFLPGLAESLPLVTELDRCRLPGASGMEADPNYRTLKDTLQKLTSLLPSEATYGETLAQAYAQGFTAKFLVDPTGPANSGTRLVMETKRAFARVLGAAIRAEYLKTLGSELTSARFGTFFDTLFWTPPTTPTSADKVTDSLVRDQLAAFIDRDRAFDGLRKKFRLIGADSIANDLFPAGVELEDSWAAVHVFLADLQTFLLGLDLAEGGVKRVMEMRFRFVLVPRTSESGSIWDLASTPVPQQRAFFYFPANDSANTLQRVPMNSPGRPAVSNWGFDVTNDSRALRLVWSTSTKQDEAAIDADRYHVTIPSCLGPLLMAWAGSRLDPTDGLRYRVTLKPVGSERVAPFDIEFDRPLPVRPARP